MPQDFPHISVYPPVNYPQLLMRIRAEELGEPGHELSLSAEPAFEDKGGAVEFVVIGEGIREDLP